MVAILRAWICMALVLCACAPPALALKRPRLDGAPTLRLGYGISDPSLEESDAPFAESPLLELGVGSHTISILRSGIASQEVGELQISRFSSTIGDGAGEGEFDPDAWRFALNWTTGYGYRWGVSRIILNHTSGLGLTYADLAEGDLARLTDEGRHHLGYFDDEVTFGSHFAGGLLVQVGPIIGVEASYERAMAFRRLLFLKWAGSELIEQVGHSLIETFVARILERRPGAAPVVNFLLRNGLAYAAYELRSDEMNYPFESGPPLMFDTMKLGLRFNF